MEKHTDEQSIATPSFVETDPDGNQLTRSLTTSTFIKPKRFYNKPAQPRDFSKSAKKRQSVLALGSITHLQHFYAKRGIIIKPKQHKEEKKLSINTNITDLLLVTSEPDEFPPTPLPPSPPPLPAFITSKLDVETDPEVLLATCHVNIQEMIDAWHMTTGEAQSDENSIDILDVVATTTKAVQSVKNYSMYKEDLSPDSLVKIRTVALEVLEMISNLEKNHRSDDSDDSSSEDGHIYKETSFRSLDKERQILKKYLEVIEECLLFDDKEAYPNFSYLRHISRHATDPSFGSVSSATSEDEKRDSGTALITPPSSPGYQNLDWVNSEQFEDTLARYHSFLEAHRPSKSKQAPDYTPLPDPRKDKDEFLAVLADGRLLCVIYNTVVRRSKRPFGFIEKIHEDTTRTYRATENLKFFAAACKFRFDIKFEEFNPTEIVRLTDTGKAQLEKTLEIFCEKVMNELISTGAYKQSPLSRVASIYLSDSASSSQTQLQANQNTTITEADLAKAFGASISVTK